MFVDLEKLPARNVKFFGCKVFIKLKKFEEKIYELLTKNLCLNNAQFLVSSFPLRSFSWV